MRSSYLLSAGVECLLHDQQELEVVSIDSDIETNLVDDIIRIQPDVMVVDESTVIANLTSLVHLFEKLPYLRVIVVHLENNHMSVFDKRHVPIQQLTDFFAAL